MPYPMLLHKPGCAPCARRAGLRAWQRRLRFGINSLAKHAPPAASSPLR